MCHQLKVVLWKNLVIRKRHYLLTICEALVPILLFLLIAYGRSKISGFNKTEITDVTYYDKSLIDPHLYSISSETRLLFTPNSKYFDDIVHTVQEELQLINNNVRGFNSAEQLMEDYIKSKETTPVIAITFNTNATNKFDYVIRTHEPSYFSWKTDKLFFPSHYTFQPGQGSVYYMKGIITLQKALDMAFIQKQSNGTKLDFKLWTQEFPYPPYKVDSAIQSIFIDYLPLITLFSFIFVCPAVLKRVVEEKYSGIKELMKMVGMKNWMLWLGWFIYSMIPVIFSVTFIVIFMKVDIFGADYPAIEHTDGTVLFVFLILYCMTVTIFCFFISTLFHKPTSATIAGILIWILSYFVPKYLLGNETNIPYFTNVLVLFLPNMALHYGYSVISVFEEREIGVRWTNVHTHPSNGANDITMCTVFTMLLVDSLLYATLTFYVDRVNPGKYGVKEPYFFIFSSIKKRFNTLFRRDSVAHHDVESMHLEYVETGQGLKKGIELHGLTKRYGKKLAVNNLSMDIYQDQITVLLGHNGAGKSTTMGMITGLLSKTAGTILMNGEPMKSRSEMTETIGLCPQHNLLFPDLTVFEHLKFFAMLRGKTAIKATLEINSLLEKLNLKDKANCLADTLSGGMKRKLCLGMAIVGGSKILILDEPSSGMDPESRRHLWDLLLDWRNKKTILITTHFMEEADALGDWIAIMSDGNLRCFGTPMFLKKKYETGYHLSLLLNNDIRDEIQFRSKQIHKIEAEIAKFVNGAKCKSVNGNEVLFVLPFEENYYELFNHLELHKDDLGLEKISLTTTTLEDVFLNSRTLAGQDENDTVSESDTSSVKALSGGWTKGESKYLLTVEALFKKRVHFMAKKYLTYLLPFLMAIIFLALCIYLAGLSNASNNHGPALKLELSKYGETRAFIQTTNESKAKEMQKYYDGIVRQQGSQAVSVSPPSNVTSAILKEADQNIAFYRHHLVVSGEILYADENIVEANAWYNSFALHSAPISVNLLTNALAKLVLGEQYSISMTNWPLESLNQEPGDEQLSVVQIGLLWLMIFPIGVLFFLGSFVFFPNIELSTNFFQLQFMCGVTPGLYWFVNFLWDYLIFIIFAFLLAVFNTIWAPFRGWNEMGTLFLILLMYGFCGIPFTYLFSRKKSASAGFALHIILNLLLGVVCTVVIAALLESGDEYYVDKGEIFRTIFLIFIPQFGLTFCGVEFAKKTVGIYNLDQAISRNKFKDFCQRNPNNPCCFVSSTSAQCTEYRQYMSTLGIHFVYMFIGGIIYLGINIMWDSYWRKKISNKITHYFYEIRQKFGKTQSETKHDQNKTMQVVGADRNDNNSGVNNTNTLKVNKLRKSYSGREVVKNIDFCLNNGECMGILGVNGAGKTTTFRMLTREEIKDDGSITANGKTIDQAQYLSNLGYCPQSDALNFALTGREILSIMAMLRGVNDPNVVDQFLNLFELESLADVPCGHYSGGNKRKLSFAVAVIGFPDFVLLDEPTNGVDPSTRRKFWSLINSFKKTQKTSFILTSHSMVECEALCNDLKIMKEGTIRKQGTISKLKGEIGGFSIKLKLKHIESIPKIEVKEDVDEVDGHTWSSNAACGSVDDLKTYLNQTYRGEVKDEHSGLLHYYVMDKDMRLSQLFREIETLKMANPHLIEDYSISEASLEDVFLTVARSK